MRKWTTDWLIGERYEIENAKVTRVDLSMADHGALCLEMVLKGNGWECYYGGYVIGHGYLDADEFSGSDIGMEYIMRIMDTVGVSRFNDMVGKYIRVATKGWGSTVKIFGNIIKDKWFDSESFFADKENPCND